MVEEREIKIKKNKETILYIIRKGKEGKKAKIRIHRAARRLYNYIMTFVV